MKLISCYHFMIMNNIMISMMRLTWACPEQGGGGGKGSGPPEKAQKYSFFARLVKNL